VSYLRDYQEVCCDKVTSALSNGSASTLMVMPTGTGKTETFLDIADRWPQGNVLVLAHREELIWQPWERWQQKTGERGEIEMGDFRRSTRPKSKLTFASKDSLYREKRLHRAFPDPMEVGLIIIDEAHHAVRQNKTYQRILDYFSVNPDLRIMGATATPDRTDEQALGQTFDTVAFEYPLLDPAGGASAIGDGWLVPIQQEIITVEDIRFNEIKVQGGDFQGKALQSEMTREVVLHKVAVPTMELAGSDQCMVFASGIQQASRLAEIFNRKMDGRAFCLVSKVPASENYQHVVNSRDKQARKRALKGFADGFYQYAVNVGCLTEGYDCPQVRTLSMGRPSKSRSLVAQMCGRGTRILPGVIEGDGWRLGTPEERKAAIAASAKPHVKILDFVGNSRHKLITSTDVLGGKYPDEVIDLAKEELAKDGGDVIRALQEAEVKHSTHLEERRKIMAAGVKWDARRADPFGVLDVVPSREPGWHKGRMPTHKQKEALAKFGVEWHKIEDLTFHGANTLMGSLIGRSKEKLASYKQCRLLKKHGLATKEMTRQEASSLIDRLAKNNWKHV
jgi:superfamily II DNA or RNA helicase